ncbi:MAG: hypothetical protein EHM73_08785, partial [Chroococcales cyanobacterium metabat2.561]
FIQVSREAQLFVGWVSGSVTHAGVGFHASTQPTFYVHLIFNSTHLLTRKVIGFYLKNRSHKSGKKLWKSLPFFARQYAIAYPELLLNHHRFF